MDLVGGERYVVAGQPLVRPAHPGGIVVADADAARLALLHRLGQGLHEALELQERGGEVDLVQVHRLDLEPFETTVQGSQDGARSEPIRQRGELRGDQGPPGLAFAPVLPEEPADYLLGGAVSVDLRGIEEPDASLEARAESRRHVVRAVVALVAPEPLCSPGPRPDPQRFDPVTVAQPDPAPVLHRAPSPILRRSAALIPPPSTRG